MFEQMKSRNKGNQQKNCYYFQYSSHKIDQQQDKNKLQISAQMATQHTNQKIQNNTIQGLKLLVQKEELIKQLVQRCNRQEKRLTKLLFEHQSKEQFKVVQFKQYRNCIKEFEVNNKKISVICLKMQSQLLEKQRSIIISNQLEPQALAQYNIPKQPLTTIKIKKSIGIIAHTDSQSQFEKGLAQNVQVLKQNIIKCQSLLTSLKQLNEGDHQKRTPVLQSKIQSLNEKQRNQGADELKTTIENLQLQLLKYSQTNEKLRQNIKQLEQAQEYYLTVIEQLQINRIKMSHGSPTKQFRQMNKQEKNQTKQRKKQSKVYLVNY